MIKDVAVLVAVLALTVVSGLRWLRVSQREHYLPGRAGRIARLWYSRSGQDAMGELVAVAWPCWPWCRSTPRGSPRSRARDRCAGAHRAVRPRAHLKLAWTGRLRRLAAGWIACLVPAACSPGSSARRPRPWSR